MPDDLRIGAVVDVSQLQAGFAQSQEQVQAATQNMAISFQECSTRSRAAVRQISDSTKEMSASVSAESLKVAEATKAQVQAMLEVRAANVLVKDSSIDAAQSTALLAAAQERARTAATALRTAQEGVAEATSHVVPQTAAASAAVRSLEGNPGIRAVERFLSTTLQLGPAMQAAFPLIGAFAFGSIIVEMVAHLIEVRERAMRAGEEIGRAFAEGNERIEHGNDALQLQNDKLQDQIDKLSGHPNNGLATALGEAKVAADKLQESLASDLKELQSLLKAHDVSEFSALVAGVAPTGGTNKEITDEAKRVEQQGLQARAAYNKALLDAKGDHDRQEAATRDYYGRMDAIAADAARKMRGRATDIAKAQSDLDGTAAAASASGGARSGAGRSLDLSDQRIPFEQAAERFDAIQQRAQLSATNFQDEQKKGALEGAKSLQEAGNKAAEARFKQMEGALNQWKLLTNVTAKAEYDFWAARIDAFSSGSQQYEQVTAKMAEIATASARRAHEEIEKFKTAQTRGAGEDTSAQERAQKGVDEMMRRTSEDVMQAGERWARYHAEVAKGDEIGAAQARSMEEARLQLLEMAGGITAYGAAQAEARIHAEQHRATLKALRDELAALNAEIAKNPGGIATAQQATARQGIQNQITQEQGRGAVQGLNDAGKEASTIASPYQRAFAEIGRSWEQTQAQILRGQVSVGEGFRRMGADLVLNTINSLENMAVKWAQHEVFVLAQHQIANAAKVASDATAATASESISSASTLKQGFHYAVLAAQKAFSAFADIPLVGPELGAVAAAGTFAAVLALNTFEKGGIVGGSYGAPTIIQAHAGERVLSQTQTKTFEKLVDGGGGAPININMGGNNFSAANGDFRSQLSAHRAHLAKEIKGMRRDGLL